MSAGHSRWVWDAVYSADSSYLVTASSDMLVKLWEVGSATTASTAAASAGAGAGGGATSTSAATPGAGEVVRTYSGHSKAVTAVALNDAAPIPSAGAAIAHNPNPNPNPAGAAAAGGGGGQAAAPQQNAAPR